MGVTRIGNQPGSENFTVAATLGSLSFHNLFHKAGSAFVGRSRHEKVSYSFNICGKSRNYSKVTELLSRWISNGVRAAQNPDREEEQRPQKRQNSLHSDSHDPERQQNQPHKRISDQRQQGNRPAKHQQDTPQEESSHGQLTSLTP
jgi:hypothetical protein